LCNILEIIESPGRGFNEYLGYGNLVVEKKNKDVVRLRVDKFSLIDEHLIPFFTNYPPPQNRKLKEFCGFAGLVF